MPCCTYLAELFCVPFLAGVMSVVLFGRSPRRSISGLLFHSIQKDQRYLTLSSLPLSLFTSIVHRLNTSDFHSLTISRAADISQHLLPMARPLLLTFDDGCRSFYTHALPLLEELKIKSTVFPVAGYIGKPSSWDILPAFDHLTKEEISAISSCGHEIGSHGMTHTDLTFLSNSDLAAELIDSKKILEDIIGKEVSAISFPFGSWNKRVWERAVEAGYRHGTVYRKHGMASPGLFPVYGVYRFDSPDVVLAKINPPLPLSIPIAYAKMMSHFSKGATVWKFNKRYRIGR